ncbi:MAG TPA: hypothetical protein VNZ52_16430, partial [Candidatus Thermoplasmatota archaeon]|nr:hypothetical protein [Candidatus Thermoplasmatota archaeon]
AALLAALASGPRAFPEVLGAPGPAYGLGDVQVAHLLRLLANAEPPLLHIEGPPSEWPRWTLRLTEAGTAVVRGEQRANVPRRERWVGGVSGLTGAPWHWDAVNRRLVQ